MIIALDARPLVHRQIAGAEQRARNIVSAWIAASAADVAKGEKPSHQFHLIYPRAEDGSFDDSFLQNLPDNFHRVEISSYQMPTKHHTGARFLNALTRAIGRVKPDVYHSFTPHVPRIQACPVVPTIHDVSFDLDPNVRRTTAGRALHHIAALSTNYAARLIAVSSQTKYDIASIYHVPAERIDVIYNGIDPVFAPASATEIPKPQPVHIANDIRPPYLLAVGADIPRRNYARMLAAMKFVWSTPDGARTRWVLAGRDDWNVSDIYAAARKEGLLDRMRFVRSPTNVDLADLYRGATLTVCASSFEGFGLSVLESLACGTAVACSDMRSLREVAEDAAVYFPHDDAESMGQAIAGLLEDAEYRRQLKYRGIYRASLFTWQTGAQLTLASLEAAMAE